MANPDWSGGRQPISEVRVTVNSSIVVDPSKPTTCRGQESQDIPDNSEVLRKLVIVPEDLYLAELARQSNMSLGIHSMISLQKFNYCNCNSRSNVCKKINVSDLKVYGIVICVKKIEIMV
jgi:hypothetical protein